MIFSDCDMQSLLELVDILERPDSEYVLPEDPALLDREFPDTDSEQDQRGTIRLA